MFSGYASIWFISWLDINSTNVVVCFNILTLKNLIWSLIVNWRNLSGNTQWIPLSAVFLEKVFGLLKDYRQQMSTPDPLSVLVNIKYELSKHIIQMEFFAINGESVLFEYRNENCNSKLRYKFFIIFIPPIHPLSLQIHCM